MAGPNSIPVERSGVKRANGQNRGKCAILRAMSAAADDLAIDLLVLPETTPTCLYGLLEVFSAVGVAWREITGEAAAARRIRARLVGRDGRPFVSTSGAPLVPDASLADAGTANVAIVTDLQLSGGVDPRGHWVEEAAWMRAQFEAGATVCSVCTGSVLLAEAGMLDGEEATTHWGATRLFEQHYPAVRLRPERLLCPAGPDRRLITGGGSGAWADLALYLIGRYCGAAEAVRIAKVFVLGDHADGQLPFTAMIRHRYHEDAVIAGCQAWIASHYAEPNPVARMAARSGLRERTFKRRFRKATGYAPVDYVQALRIEEARQSLESSPDPVDTIAAAVGYEDPAWFRRLFKRRTGLTPSRYRQRWGRTNASI